MKKVVHFAPESVVHIRPESVVHFPRNTHLCPSGAAEQLRATK
jgi:hypothetical protein